MDMHTAKKKKERKEWELKFSPKLPRWVSGYPELKFPPLARTMPWQFIRGVSRPDRQATDCLNIWKKIEKQNEVKGICKLDDANSGIGCMGWIAFVCYLMTKITLANSILWILSNLSSRVRFTSQYHFVYFMYIANTEMQRDGQYCSALTFAFGKIQIFLSKIWNFANTTLHRSHPFIAKKQTEHDLNGGSTFISAGSCKLFTPLSSLSGSVSSDSIVIPLKWFR